MKKSLKTIFEVVLFVISAFPSVSAFFVLVISSLISWLYLKDRFLIFAIGIDIAVLIVIGCVYGYRFNLRKSFFKKGIDFLKGRGVKAKRIQDASIRKSVFFKRKVFWAVVPNKDLSIIHLASINCLKYLMRNGFDVFVLVYDLHYIGRRKNEAGITNTRSIEREVRHCIEQFKHYGLKNSMLSPARVTYKYESKSMHKQYHRNYSKVSAEINLDELATIGSKTLTKKKRPVIRLLKPISIISYLISIEESPFSASIAMTLSGADEELLYKKCHQIMSNINSSGYVPFSMYIPKFDGFQEGSPNLPGVLDAAYCLTSENKEAVKKRATGYKYDLKNPDDSVLFLINHLLYNYSEDSTFKPKCVDNDQSMTIDNFMHTCSGRNCPNLPSCVIEGIYNKFLGIPGTDIK